MANWFDAEYDKSSDPKQIFVWEQDYITNEIIKKTYPIEDYIYFYVEAVDKDKTEKHLISQTNKPVQKVFCENYKDYDKGITAKNFSDMGLDVFESDIEPIRKCLLDNYGVDNQKAPAWNLALYDIETDVLTEQTFAEMRDNADREITAISIWYAKENKFYEFALVPQALRFNWDLSVVEPRGNSEIHYFDAERELLEYFFEMNKYQQVMAMGAWNGDLFDTGYIYKRAELHFGAKGAAQRMGRFTKVRKSKVERGDKVEHIIKPIGMVWFDCLEAYKKNGPELESFALNAVVEEELGSSKVDFGDFVDGGGEIEKYQKRIKYLEKLLAEGNYEEG